MPSSQHPTTSAGQKSRSGRRSAWQAPRAWHNQRRSGPTCGSCNLSLQGGRTQQLSFLRSQPRKDRGESAISGSRLAGGPDTRRARARISGDLRVARAETSSASKPCSDRRTRARAHLTGRVRAHSRGVRVDRADVRKARRRPGTILPRRSAYDTQNTLSAVAQDDRIRARAVITAARPRDLRYARWSMAPIASVRPATRNQHPAARIPDAAANNETTSTTDMAAVWE